VCSGIAEKNEDDIPETADDEPFMAIDGLRDTLLKGADHLAQVFETDAVGSPWDANQLARKRCDLASFRISTRRCCRLPLGVDPRRLGDELFL
jgi:hypothetical protein